MKTVFSSLFLQIYKNTKHVCFLAILVFLSHFLFFSCNINTVPSQSKDDPHPNMSHLIDDKFATPDNPVISPSKNYIMNIVNYYNGTVYINKFIIYQIEDNSNPIFTCEAEYRTRDRLFFTWDDYDNIWVYSGDIGITFWTKQKNEWLDASHDNNYPDHFYEVLPKSYKNL